MRSRPIRNRGCRRTAVGLRPSDLFQGHIAVAVIIVILGLPHESPRAAMSAIPRSNLFGAVGEGVEGGCETQLKNQLIMIC